MARGMAAFTFAEHNLTTDEEAELIKYLQFIRGERPSDQT